MLAAIAPPYQVQSSQTADETFEPWPVSIKHSILGTYCELPANSRLNSTFLPPPLSILIILIIKIRGLFITWRARALSISSWPLPSHSRFLLSIHFKRSDLFGQPCEFPIQFKELIPETHLGAINALAVAVWKLGRCVSISRDCAMSSHCRVEIATHLDQPPCYLIN